MKKIWIKKVTKLPSRGNIFAFHLFWLVVLREKVVKMLINCMNVCLIVSELMFTFTQEKLTLSHVLIIYSQKRIFVLMGGHSLRCGIVWVCSGLWINGKNWVIDSLVTDLGKELGFEPWYGCCYFKLLVAWDWFTNWDWRVTFYFLLNGGILMHETYCKLNTSWFFIWKTARRKPEAVIYGKYFVRTRS